MADVAQPTTLAQLTADTKEAHEHTQQEQRELNRMIDQSRGEGEKLAQRNAAIAAHLRQLQGNFENMPRPDIRTANEAAQDAEQRLFPMHGQLEKLQGEQANLEGLANHLQGRC